MEDNGSHEQPSKVNGARRTEDLDVRQRHVQSRPSMALREPPMRACDGAEAACCRLLLVQPDQTASAQVWRQYHMKS
jgi:hypothetical protein